MGAGEKAGWLALASGTIIAVIGGAFARSAGWLTRRTEIDKLYGGRVESLEKQLAEARKEIDAKDAIIQELREQHVLDLPCIERENRLKADIEKMIESEKQLKGQLQEFMLKFIGAKEPPEGRKQGK